ncbi:uncharacterized protein [Lolium perenne]|uniref:uncharacterized protein n=1 Tax=Lolium perenne TaxID=4522 RepID=UPI0021EA7FDA
MDLSRLLLLCLVASAAVTTMAAPPAACDLSTLAPNLARHCQFDPDVPSFLLNPTAQCCEALAASLPEQEEMALPCLCRAAADPWLVAARLDVPRIFALYRSCVKGSFRRGPSFANWYCKVEKTGDIATAACNAATLATKVSRFCVIDKRFVDCCRAVVPTVVLTGRPPCLCRVGAEPQLAAAGLSATGILELYAECGGRSPVGPHLVDACKVWNLPTPALARPSATMAAAVLPPTTASCAPQTLAFLMVSYLYKDPTAESCRDLVASVDLGGGLPCLCHAAVEHVTVGAQLKATDLLAIYNACGGLHLGGAEHKAAATSCEGYGLPLPLPPTGKAPTTQLQQNHDGGAIRVGPDTLPETATA